MARVAKQVPRASAFASRARASASTRSKGGGIRKRKSRPLALTLLISKTQRHWPLDPPARAKPVMLLTAIRSAILRQPWRPCIFSFRASRGGDAVHSEFRRDAAGLHGRPLRSSAKGTMTHDQDPCCRRRSHDRPRRLRRRSGRRGAGRADEARDASPPPPPSPSPYAPPP